MINQLQEETLRRLRYREELLKNALDKVDDKIVSWRMWKYKIGPFDAYMGNEYDPFEFIKKCKEGALFMRAFPRITDEITHTFKVLIKQELKEIQEEIAEIVK